MNRVYRKLLGVFVAVALVLSMTGMGQAATKITIKAVTAWPKTVWEVGNFNKFLEMVKENVANKYPGELEIQYIGGPEVIPFNEQVEAARMGVVDMVFTTDGYYTSAVPEVNALSVSPLDGWEERATGVNDFLSKIHQEKINCIYLGRLGHNLPFTVYLAKSVKNADLTGLKIRCSPTLIGFLKKYKANPVVLPPTDVYTALERGVVDGFMWPAGLIRDWGWDKVTKTVITPGVYNGANVVLVNKKKWDSLPAHLQKLLIDTEDEAARFAKKRSVELVKNEREALEKKGVKYIDLSPAEAKKFTEAANSSLWDIIIEKSPVNGPKLKQMLTK
ncbi:MAG: TRAP transporter substrate-binding protein DctP [Syntrophales bacterium]|jgi:TRAP-type C4-dicarboxylate transport system substrate-binding protein|nr:TRAP transporter substrate-binding protein DctP [Syntrophales bacterium]